MDRFQCPLRELKFDAGDMTFEGYGAVFGNTDAVGDVIQKGAFAATLHEAKTSGQWPAMLEQHGGYGMTAQDMTPIGVWTDLSEDDVGLKVSGTLAPTVRGQEMHALMKMKPRPAINGLSIGFKAIDWTMRVNPTDPRRTLKTIQLIEISPVTFPANGKARVSSVKSLEELCTLPELEDYLRDAGGFSRNEAKAIINRCKSVTRGDAGTELDELTAMVKAARLFQ